MSYNIPVCDCGNELNYTEHMINSRVFKVGAKGKPLIRTLQNNEEYLDKDLSCFECGNIYECSTDVKTRIIKGEIKREGFE